MQSANISQSNPFGMSKSVEPTNSISNPFVANKPIDSTISMSNPFSMIKPVEPTNYSANPYQNPIVSQLNPFSNSFTDPKPNIDQGSLINFNKPSSLRENFSNMYDADQINFENYVNIKKSIENPELSHRSLFEEITKTSYSISSLMTSIEITSVSDKIIDLVKKSSQRSQNFIKVCVSFQFIELICNVEDDTDALLSLSRNVVHLILSIAKTFSDVNDFFLFEIFTRSDVFTDKIINSNEALQSLHFSDLSRLFNGGDLQVVINSELKKLRKIAVVYADFLCEIRNYQKLWEVLKNIINKEKGRDWLPVIAGFLLRSKQELSQSNAPEFATLVQIISLELPKFESKCNVLIFRAFITQIKALINI